MERKTLTNKGEAFALRKLLSGIAGRDITKKEENRFKQILANEVGVHPSHIDCEFVSDLWDIENDQKKIAMRERLFVIFRDLFVQEPNPPPQAQTRQGQRRLIRRFWE